MTKPEGPLAVPCSVRAQGCGKEEAAQGMDMGERRSGIVELINQEGYVSFSRLKSAFPDVSEMTLRTDLKKLDEERLIVRVHGGAKSVSFAVGTDDLLARRSLRHAAEKAAIAQKAARLLRPDTTVFIDSGSTTTALARKLPDMRLLVFTNSLTVAIELSRLKKVTSQLVGGRLNTYSLSTVGGSAMEFVREISFEQLFLGVTGYGEHGGFTCGSDDEAALKRALVASAEETVALVDSSKVGRNSTFPICSISDVAMVVSDDGVSREFRQACENAGTELL